MIPAIILFAVVGICAYKCIRVVPENERMVVLRLGRFLKEQGPGITVTMPFIDRGYILDIRIHSFDVAFPEASSVFHVEARINSPARALLKTEDPYEYAKSVVRRLGKEFAANHNSMEEFIVHLNQELVPCGIVVSHIATTIQPHTAQAPTSTSRSS
jgi:regulator of protease activity HflC (stomatin/prohibitin superfamily)